MRACVRCACVVRASCVRRACVRRASCMRRSCVRHACVGTYGNFVHGNLWELMGTLCVGTYAPNKRQFCTGITNRPNRLRFKHVRSASCFL